ncbi:MAG: lytic transglycosylase domain-containing protein [Caulobacteraceae bacterium]|nr:MAG: lytic transglycosylase domain-containing protein [Caulobacteraceae bacterium]
MALVRRAGWLVMVLAASPVAAQGVSQWREPVAEASSRFGIPAEWIERVMRIESAGRTRLAGRPIVSSAGAMGLMQLMPGTWAAMRDRLGLGPDPHHPRDNILAGSLYLRLMYDRYGHPGLFAAYNAGPGRYEQHLRAGRQLPAETRAYVAAITGPRPMTRAQGSAGRLPTPMQASAPLGPGVGPHREPNPAGMIFFPRRLSSQDVPPGTVAAGVDPTAARPAGASRLFAIGGDAG